MSKVALFGGTFDPVQTEHVNIVKNAIEQLGLDKVIIMPSFIPPHKSRPDIAPPQTRLKMCDVAFGKIPKVEISSWEIDSGGSSYTYLTVEEYKNTHADDDLYFIVGSDMLSTFHEWKNPQRILNCCTLIYVKRSKDMDEDRAESIYYSHFDKPYVLLDYVGKPVSSTDIRSKLKLNLPVDDLLPEGVLDVITAYGLYKPDNLYAYVNEKLPLKRKAHTQGVIVTAVYLARRLHADVKKAEVSALLHDVAKYDKVEDYPGFTPPKGITPNTLHQYLGAYVAENVLKIEDKEILNAINYHTTARANMGLLEKIVYIADLIEPSRTFPDVYLIREEIQKDFEKGFVFCIDYHYKFLQRSNLEIDDRTKEAVNYYLNYNKEDKI